VCVEGVLGRVKLCDVEIEDIAPPKFELPVVPEDTEH
jgi:hypothetical protein